MISIDWLDSWFYFVQSARSQGNQLKSFLLLKNNHKTLIKVFSQTSVIARYVYLVGQIMITQLPSKPHSICRYPRYRGWWNVDGWKSFWISLFYEKCFRSRLGSQGNSRVASRSAGPNWPKISNLTRAVGSLLTWSQTGTFPMFLPSQKAGNFLAYELCNLRHWPLKMTWHLEVF